MVRVRWAESEPAPSGRQVGPSTEGPAGRRGGVAARRCGFVAAVATLVALGGCLAPEEGAPAGGQPPLEDLAADGFGPTEEHSATGECPRFDPIREVSEVESPEGREVSAIAASRRNPGVLWGLTDSGHEPALFAFSAADGSHLGTFILLGVVKEDWVDIAIGPGPAEGVDYLYVIDTGYYHRELSRPWIFRVPEPELPVEDPSEEPVALRGVEAIDVAYQDGEAHDAEALIVDPVNGEVLILARNRDGAVCTNVFLLAPPFTAGQVHMATPILPDHQPDDLDGWVAAADVSPAGDEVVLTFRTGDVRHWYRPDAQSLWASFFFEPCRVLRTEEPFAALAIDPSSGDLLALSKARPLLHRIARDADD